MHYITLMYTPSASYNFLTEVREYALRIGIEPDVEPQLLPLARDGLMKALPSGWTPW